MLVRVTHRPAGHRTSGPPRASSRKRTPATGRLDPYVRGPKRMAVEPRRVVVEFHPDEYRVLEAFAGVAG